VGSRYGLATKVVQVLSAPIEADLVEEVKDDEPPPPPPPPEMERPPVEVPPPEVAIDLPMETTTTAFQDVTDKPPPPAPPPPPRIAGKPAKMKTTVDPDQILSAWSQAPRGAGFAGCAGMRTANGRLLANRWSRRLPAFRSSMAQQSKSRRQTGTHRHRGRDATARVLRQVQSQIRNEACRISFTAKRRFERRFVFLSSRKSWKTLL
jgi:hypothetical protein